MRNYAIGIGIAVFGPVAVMLASCSAQVASTDSDTSAKVTPDIADSPTATTQHPSAAAEATPAPSMANLGDQSFPAKDAACSSNLADVQTLTEAPTTSVLACRYRDGAWIWLETDFHRPVTKYLTVNPTEYLAFMGDVRGDEADVMSGTQWVGLPQTPGSQCTMEQEPADNSWSKEALTAPEGEPLTFSIKYPLMTLHLKGYCLWMQTGG